LNFKRESFPIRAIQGEEGRVYPERINLERMRKHIEIGLKRVEKKGRSSYILERGISEYFKEKELFPYTICFSFRK